VFETKVPAAHEPHIAHEAAFVVPFQVPLEQATQARSAVAAPALLTASPATQLRKAAQLAALLVELKVPDAQAVHARSAVAKPATLTY
jgi:hypothetical protein